MKFLYSKFRNAIVPLLAATLIAGCATTTPYRYESIAFTQTVTAGSAIEQYEISQDTKNRVLGLDPENISQQEVAEVLSLVPAPRILNFGGGIYTAHILMVNFSKFLIGMGYPEQQIRNPLNGEYSYSSYYDINKVVGAIAWYYEREGLPLLLIGHSLGGMQVVKALHVMGGTYGKKDIEVFNPIRDAWEGRSWIQDPYSENKIELHDLNAVQYGTSIGSGGISLVFPNQLSFGPLSDKVPGNTEYFTSYMIQGDIFAGNLLSSAHTKKHVAVGDVNLRHVTLPLGYSHVSAVKLDHLLQSEAVVQWIRNYKPSSAPTSPEGLKGNTKNILLAADIWHSIKKQWCLTAQRLVRETS